MGAAVAVNELVCRVTGYDLTTPDGHRAAWPMDDKLRDLIYRVERDGRATGIVTMQTVRGPVMARVTSEIDGEYERVLVIPSWGWGELWEKSSDT